MARPSEYNFELCEEICDRIAEGNNVVAVLKSDDRFPDWTTFRRWKNNNDELRILYVSSQQDKAIALEEEIDELRKMLMNGDIEYPVYNALVNTLKWKMAKMYPKVFGEKIDHTTDGEKIQTPVFNINYVKPVEEE